MRIASTAYSNRMLVSNLESKKMFYRNSLFNLRHFWYKRKVKVLCNVLINTDFDLDNACYGIPCQNGGTCFLDSSVKGYNCSCIAGYDPTSDCRTGIIFL